MPGQWCPNNYCYKPQLTTQGTTDWQNFSQSMDKVDERLGQLDDWVGEVDGRFDAVDQRLDQVDVWTGRWPTLGSQGYATLQQALQTIGSAKSMLYVPAGTVSVTSDTTVPANVHLVVMHGGVFDVASGVTLTINGPITAGPYQIFQWSGTGTVDLRGSPVVDCPVEWWGARRGTAYDCAAALTKAASCLANHQNLRFGPGVYRLATPVVLTGNLEGGQRAGVGLIGTGKKTVILVDTAGNVCLTIGQSGTTSYYWRLRDLFFIGASNCCTTALAIIRANYSVVEGVSFLVGSTDYAMLIKGCENTSWKLGFGWGAQVAQEYGLSYGQMANNLKVTNDGAQWMNNTWNDLEVLMSGTVMGAYGIYIENTRDNWRIRGDIENVTTAVRAVNCQGLQFEALHIENCTNGFQIEGCRNITILNCKPKNPTGHTNVIKNSAGISIINCQLARLVVYPGVTGVTLANSEIGSAYGLVDLSGCLEVYGGVSYYNATLNTQYNLYGPNDLNLLANALLSRWRSDRPDGGWGTHANATWTRTGVGQSDTTRHIAPYAAKIVSTGTAYLNYTLTAQERAAVAGHYVTGTAWAMLPSGQTFSSHAVILNVQATAPAWSANTAYRLGEAVTKTGISQRLFVCVQAGTSGSTEPNWTSDVGAEYEDGTVRWVCVYGIGQSQVGMPMGTSQADGQWRHLSAGCYIPVNATNVYFQLNTFAQTSGNGTCYVAEPGLYLGSRPPRGIRQGKDEHESLVQVGPNRMTWGSVIPTDSSSPLYGQWAQQGDVHWNTGATAGQSPGWVCTTSGVNGTGAVWKAMANLAA